MAGAMPTSIPTQINYMNKTTFLTIGIVGLLLLNAVTLFILFRMQGEKDHQGREGGGPANFIVDQLRLDENQQKQFADLRHAHQDFVRKHHGEEKNLHDAYFNLLKTDHPDKTQVDSIAGLMANKHKELEEITFEHFQKLRAICRDDQKKLFDETIDEIAKMVGGSPPRRGGPPPR
jgi:periplasmic protein CpxP/Spy